MIRPGTIFWTVLVMLAGYAMFQVKYEVSRLDQRLQGINRQIAEDQDQIHVLHAEWAVLTQPKRLEELSKRAGLDLQPIRTPVLGALDQPPLRNPPASQPAAVAAASGATAQIADLSKVQP